MLPAQSCRVTKMANLQIYCERSHQSWVLLQA
ncbi:MAG: hypothetical protein HOC23_02405 [Halieaceae bacterium]|nr:hypothetical protein [Halieaceae bacterium]